MEERGQIRVKIWKSKVVQFFLMFLAVSIIAVLAGDVIVKEGDITVDTNVLHVDSTNNEVGIGTTNPGARLEVRDNGYTATTTLFNIKADDAVPWLLNFRQDAANQDWAFYIANDDALRIRDRTNNRDVMYFDNVGNVFIGPAPSPTPYEKLTVNGNVKATGFIQYSKAFVGNALDILTNMKARNNTTKIDGWAPVEHTTLPGSLIKEYISEGSCAQQRQILPEDIECVDLPDGTSKVYGRSLDGMVAVNSRAIVQLKEEIDALKTRVDALERR